MALIPTPIQISSPEHDASTSFCYIKPAKRDFVLAWIGLIVSTLSLAAVGPTFKYLQASLNVAAARASAWRNQAMLIVLALPLLVELAKTPAHERRAWFRVIPPSPRLQSPGAASAEESVAQSAPGWHVGWYMCVICVCWSVSLVFWVQALRYTSTVRASLFSSTYPLMLLAYFRFVKKQSVSWGEVFGVCVALLGTHAESRTENSWQNNARAVCRLCRLCNFVNRVYVRVCCLHACCPAQE
jgi:drug/metabolite transporter (DMT)-like permease